jgi:hypothetical protein
MRGLRRFIASRSFTLIAGMKGNLRTVLIAALAGLLGAGVTALAQRTNYLGTVFIADTTTPTNQLKVNSDGSINVNAQ